MEMKREDFYLAKLELPEIQNFKLEMTSTMNLLLPVSLWDQTKKSFDIRMAISVG